MISSGIINIYHQEIKQQSHRSTPISKRVNNHYYHQINYGQKNYKTILPYNYADCSSCNSMVGRTKEDNYPMHFSRVMMAHYSLTTLILIVCCDYFQVLVSVNAVPSYDT